MADSSARALPGRAPTVIHLEGELDVETHVLLALRFELALQLGDPIVVDLGDCTFADVEAIRIMRRAAAAAKENELAFVVVLPYSSRIVLRRLLLELVPELSGFSIVPSHKAARAVLSRVVGPEPGMSSLERFGLRELQASIWENASRGERLIAERDEILLENRVARDLAAALRNRS